MLALALVFLACDQSPAPDTDLEDDTSAEDTADEFGTPTPTVTITVDNATGMAGDLGVAVVDEDPNADNPAATWWATPITAVDVDEVFVAEIELDTSPGVDWWYHVGLVAEVDGYRWRCIVRDELQAAGQLSVERDVELVAGDCVREGPV